MQIPLLGTITPVCSGLCCHVISGWLPLATVLPALKRCDVIFGGCGCVTWGTLSSWSIGKAGSNSVLSFSPLYPPNPNLLGLFLTEQKN